MKRNRLFQGVVFWLHVLLIIGSYTSFLYVDWKIILFVAILLQLQYQILNGCVLTQLEMGSNSQDTFLWYYLFSNQKKISKKTVNFIIRMVLPVVILVLAIFIQLGMGLNPYISL